MTRVEFMVILLGVVLLVPSECLRIPDNPCPDIFQYRYSYNGDAYYGEIRIPYDGSGTLDLAVNASFIGYHKTKLTLNIETPKEQLLYPGTVTYNVEFPFRDLLPRITKIEFNGATYCYGPAEQPTFGNSVTNIWSSVSYNIQKYTVETGVPNNIPGVNVAPVIPNEDTSLPDSVPMNVISDRFESEQDEQCGVANQGQKLIVGGGFTKQNEFPWMVAIYKVMSETYRYYCTGVLITKQHVLTAANCIKFFNAIILPKEDALLVMGRSDLSRWATNGATLRTVEDIFIHPEYKQYTGHGDVAVLKLKEPIDVSKDIRPICLSDEDEPLGPYVNEFGIVAGWGKDTEKKNDDVPVARKIRMPIVSQETCLRSNGGSFIEITSNMTFCAGDRSGQGPCVGDSGSGFMLRINERYYLRGIVSIAIYDPNGNRSCDLNQYVVFTDIARTGSWIRSIFKK